MRAAVLMILLVTGITWAGVAWGQPAADGRGPKGPVEAVVTRAASSGDVIALTSDIPDGPQQVTLVDARQQVISVYHVDRATGTVALKSVRRFQWDLLMEEFNGVSPSPGEIRALLERR